MIRFRLRVPALRMQGPEPVSTKESHMSPANKILATLLTATLPLLAAQAQTPPAPGAAPAAGTAPAPLPPAPPRARGPALALAVEAAQTAAATCTANGYKTTQLVVDSAGVPVVMLSGDGVAERTQAIAMTKVYLALKYKAPSGEVINRAKTDAALAAELAADPKTGTPPRQGGLLLKVGNDIVGAMSVSGAPGGDKDEVCVQAGIDKIKDRLK
jgi:uncharacterized protein GlcG (DUF336 family)